MKLHKKKGFSLIEVLICVAILAVLTAIAVPIITGLVDKANDKSDNLNAQLYTSYMTKYANETPKNPNIYVNLSNDEKFIASVSGQNVFPGAHKHGGYFASNEEFWKAIRKEAIVAIKMQNTDIKIDEDNYFIPRPENADYAYIYYYVKGVVTCEKLQDVIDRTASLPNDNVDKYWVALDRVAGGINANETTSGDGKNVYVTLVLCGPGTPLPISSLENPVFQLVNKETNTIHNIINATVPNFANDNILQFSGLANGKYQLYITADNIEPYDGTSIAYKNLGVLQGEITISNSGSFAGQTAENPYRVPLIMPTDCAIRVQDKVMIYSNNIMSERFESYTGPDFNLVFTHINNGDYVKEFSNISASYTRVELWKEDIEQTEYVALGDYKMKFLSNAHWNYEENITIERNKIYPLGNSEVLQSIYTIAPQKKKVDMTINISFDDQQLPDYSISQEMRDKIKNDYGFELPFYELETHILLRCIGGGGETYDIPLSDCEWIEEDSAYQICISDIEYNPNSEKQYIVSYYNAFTNDAQKIISTTPIVINGYDIEAYYNVQDACPTNDVKFSLYAKSNGVTSLDNGTIKLTRVGTYDTITVASGTVVKDLRCGFYKAQLSYASVYGLVTDEIEIMVTPMTTDFKFTKDLGTTQWTGQIVAKEEDETAITPPTNFGDLLSMTISYQNAAGNWVAIDGVQMDSDAKYRISVPTAPLYKIVLDFDGVCFENREVEISYNDIVAKSGKINIDMYRTSKTDFLYHDETETNTLSTSSHNVVCVLCHKVLDTHSGAKEEIVTKATCTTDGCRKVLCTRENCYHQYKEEVIPKLGHDSESDIWVSEQDATCYQTGIMHRICGRINGDDTRCEEVLETKIIEKTDHIFGYYDGEGDLITEDWYIMERATCKTNGYKIRYCQNYGMCEGQQEAIILAPGHDTMSFEQAMLTGNYIFVKDYCTDEGAIEYFACTRCWSETEEIEACFYTKLGQMSSHNIEIWTFDDDYHMEECTMEGCQYTERKSHTFDIMPGDGSYHVNWCTECGHTVDVWHEYDVDNDRHYCPQHCGYC